MSKHRVSTSITYFSFVSLSTLLSPSWLMLLRSVSIIKTHLSGCRFCICGAPTEKKAIKKDENGKEEGIWRQRTDLIAHEINDLLPAPSCYQGSILDTRLPRAKLFSPDATPKMKRQHTTRNGFPAQCFHVHGNKRVWPRLLPFPASQAGRHARLASQDLWWPVAWHRRAAAGDVRRSEGTARQSQVRCSIRVVAHQMPEQQEIARHPSHTRRHPHTRMRKRTRTHMNTHAKKAETQRHRRTGTDTRARPAA